MTVDVDNDGVEAGTRFPLTWESLDWLAPLKELLDDVGLRATWFVRGDNQLMDLYGTAAHLLVEHDAFWARVLRSGDELGWHPHLYRWCDRTGSYVNERDPAALDEKLRQAHADLLSSGFAFSSVRVGEAYHCNSTMQTVDELGLDVDSTAIPGRTRNDESRSFDWGPTPNHPYHPSIEDYRVPGEGAARRILEVPMTSVLVEAPYDTVPVRRYINPSFHHEFFCQAVERYVSEIADPDATDHVLTLLLHPGEVVPRRGRHDLYAFSIDEVRRNLIHLRARLDRLDAGHRAVTLRDVGGS